MSTPSCLIDIKNTLPKNYWPQVIPALRQDTLIWKTLQNPDFRGLAISQLGSNPQKWTPAHLALLSLGSALQPDELRISPISKLDPELHAQAIQAREKQNSDSPAELTLALAGLLALSLLEDFHQTNKWGNPPDSDQWRTPLACLIGFIEKPLPLLLALTPSLVIHTILANPLYHPEHEQLMTALLASTPTRRRLALLHQLALYRPDLSAHAARLIWNNQETIAPDQNLSLDQLTSLLSNFEAAQNLITELSRTLTQAEVQLSTGYSQPNAFLRASWQTAQHLQVLLATQSALVAASYGDIQQAQVDWLTAQTPLQIPADRTAELTLCYLEKGYLTEAQQLLASLEGEQNPAVYLCYASAAIQEGNQKAALKAVLQASQEAARLSFNQVLLLGKLLLDLKQATEAVRVLDAAYRSHPNHAGLVHLLSQAHAATGAYPQAIQAIHLTVVLHPDYLDFQRDYAHIHELAGQWPAAFQARKGIIDSQKNDPQAKDYRSLATCSLHLNQIQMAETACQKALTIDPDDGLAHAILGETLARQGKIELAFDQFERAIQLTPDRAEPWLALARVQQQTGDFSEATEILRKATHSAPDQAEIHLALGKDYLQSGAISQALTSLRRANQLTESYPAVEEFHLRGQISLPLAKTLFSLGHAEEALKIIQGTSLLPEHQSTLLHLKAQILLFLGQAEEAIPLLAKALMTNPTDVALNLDYARAQLESNHDPSKAILALSALLEKDPQNVEALAWLAEALKASGDSANALNAYRKVLGTYLGEDPNWYPKLSIGMAQSALALGQPETALAALQEAWQNAPQNLEILHTLSEAYAATQLNEKSLQIAITARSLAPLSLENLTWFAELTAEIEAFDETTHALNSAIELAPHQASLYLRLGQIYQQIGDLSAAFETFCQVTKLEQALPEELYSAAQHLKELERPEEALTSMKMAVRRCQESSTSSLCINLLRDSIEIYHQLEMDDQALIILDEFFQKHPGEISLSGLRAILLQRMGKTGEARLELENALREYPNNPEINLAAGQTFYAIGDLSRALTHAQKAIEITTPNTAEGYSPAMLALTADIAAACLKEQVAQEILALPPVDDDILKTDVSGRMAYLYLRAETALQRDEEIDAASALTTALQLAPSHARTLALQARLTARHGDGGRAQKLLKDALAAWGPTPRIDITSPVPLLAISEAALELHQWSTALYFLQEASERFPQEPRTHLRLARGLVLRAEHQHLCQTLQVVRHAPGPSSISEFAHRSFEQAILASSKTSESISADISQAEITHWRTRGQAVFQPSTKHAQALGDLPQTPENRTALLATLRHNREDLQNQQTTLAYFVDDSQLLAQNTASLSGLMAQAALSLCESNHHMALDAAQSALDASVRYHHPTQPIFHALLAYVAEKAKELETARQSLENALARWVDEPRWHAWVADIQLASGETNFQGIIDHLKRAVKLEPKYGSHHLKLGQAYMLIEDSKSAIRALEQAAQLLPKESAPWLELAQAHQASGDVAQIFHNAERATEYSPTRIEPYILLTETALEINNPEKALQYCEAALKIDAKHPQILLLQSRALDLTGESVAALQAFDKALERSPKSLPLMLEHAQLIKKAIGSRPAIKTLQKLAEDYPDDSRLMALLAELLVESDQPNPAIQAAQKALQTNQGDLDCSQEANLLLTLGRLMRRNGQLDHAIQYLSDAIQCNPEAVQTYLELGRTYQDRRQHSQALDAFQQAIAVAPGDHRPYYQAGLTFKTIKDYAAAEDMLRRAAKLAPEDLSIRRQLGGLVALNLVHNRKEDIDLYVE